MKRAVAYTREIPLSESGEVISREVQEERISQFAVDHVIEIVAWYTDDSHEENALKRRGIQAFLACGQSCDLILCERAWVLARSMAGLEPVLKELDRRGMGLECAASMWDYVSQQCRRRSKSLPILPRVIQPSGKAREISQYHVVKPARLNFVNLIHSQGSNHQSAAGSRL
jgi:DNA invertase Pin-like site-specific DNA recombinase